MDDDHRARLHGLGQAAVEDDAADLVVAVDVDDHHVAPSSERNHVVHAWHSRAFELGADLGTARRKR